jgi:hypothetical protein
VGRALRLYQVVLILLLGWAAGRIPQWFSDAEAERARLTAALGVAAPASAGDDTARLAAEVAAEVAARVADETIARLIAAGWAPRGAAPELPPQRIIVETVGGGRAPETVVRVVAEQPQQPLWTGFRYDLPPGQGGAQPAGKAPAPEAPKASAKAHATASAGYAAIRAGDLKEGVRLLKEAEAMDPEAPEAKAWGADVKQLTRRWSLAAYTLSRGGGLGDPLAASPVLGGGQTGAALGYRINPLGQARVSVIGRLTAAAGPNGGIDSETSEAALGLRLEPFRKVPVALDVERRFALGLYARNAWAARVSGGAQGTVKAFGRGVKLEGYGEAGVVEGFEDTTDIYAGAQGRGGVPLFTVGRTSFDAGAGVWGGTQRSFGVTASRLDLGPSARIRVEPWPFFAQVDYRARVAGNAVPGSGPVLTVAGEF